MEKFGLMHIVEMGVSEGATKRIKLIDSAPVSFCKPSITVMLDSLRVAYDRHILTVLLTGMGSDGMEACQRLVEDDDNNIVIAQDEEPCVVWGIPGAAAKAGLCHYVLPLEEIGETVNKLIYRKVL